jgi:pimeloyl-ACP methyl ester carboxylesterase
MRSDPLIKTWRTYASCRFGQIHITAARPAADLPPDGRMSKPPLICFHTTPLSGKEFSEFQQSMARDRLVLCPDTPGYGGSDAPPSIPTIAEYAEAMADALEDLGYGARDLGNVDVLGCRTGSLIAAELAIAHAELVRAVVLTCVPLVDKKQSAEIRKNYGTEEPIFTNIEYLAKNFQNYVLNSPPEVEARRRYELFTERLRAADRAWWAADAVIGYDVEASLKALSQPTLLLVIRCILAENTRRAAHLVSGSSLIDVESQNPILKGHTGAEPWTVQPDFLAETVRRFLDQA